MTHINTQSQDIFAIAGVSNLDTEQAASISGGTLDMSDYPNGKGQRVENLSGKYSNLGWFNNKASWYQVKGKRDWLVYPNKNFKGKPLRLKAGSKGNLTGFYNNDIESARVV